jgi:DNA-binding response OmpR family regulator
MTVTTRLHVLLVDDDPDIRTIGELSLVDVGGMRCTSVDSGRAAIQSALAEEPDVVLLDMMMPGLDGAQTLVALREAGVQCPVVFLTAKVDGTDRAHYLSLGAKGVLGKPFDPITLADSVRACLRGTPE